jgi:hypothetical protein
MRPWQCKRAAYPSTTLLGSKSKDARLSAGRPAPLATLVRSRRLCSEAKRDYGLKVPMLTGCHDAAPSLVRICW